jgi:hypothetical protein
MCVKGSDILLVSERLYWLELRSPESVTLRIARGLLQDVERAQRTHVADRDRLRGLLA